MKLFLDDIRQPKNIYPDDPFGWQVVKNYKQFVRHLKEKGLPEIISFDHDLSDIHYCMQWEGISPEKLKNIEKTGYDCAKFLVQYCIENNCKLPICKVHSFNPVGKENIKQILLAFKNRETHS